MLWFLTHSGVEQDDATAGEIANLLIEQRLKGTVNAPRLAKNLAVHNDVVRGARAQSFRIKASSDATLSKRYGKFADLSKRAVSDSIIRSNLPLSKRAVLDTLRREANGTYDYGFYNSSAVICRRLTETLLIEALNMTAGDAALRDARGDIEPFSELISAAKSGQHFRLSRTSPSALDKVKLLGDGAAHHRHFLAAKSDLDSLNPGLSQLLAELAALAGLS